MTTWTEFLKEVFEWKEGTAKSRLSSGAVAEMGLVTLRVYESTQAPVFVLVSDLADFLLLKRRVLVMKPLSDELLLQYGFTRLTKATPITVIDLEPIL